jgi:hypothetical protein
VPRTWCRCTGATVVRAAGAGAQPDPGELDFSAWPAAVAPKVADGAPAWRGGERLAGRPPLGHRADLRQCTGGINLDVTVENSFW